MTKKSTDAIRRADHALVGVLALFIATVSAAGGAAAVYAPRTEQIAKPAAVVVAAAKPAPAVIADAKNTVPSQAVVIDASSVKQASITITQDSAMAELFREHRCLSEVMYYEARGEGVKGQMAIAEVVFHRLRKGNYGHSICSVVYEGAGRQGCQFSFACTRVAHRKSNRAWQQAQYLAAKILVGQARLMNTTDGAVNFHAISVNPVWSSEMEKTTQIGNHVFYKSLPRSRPL
jgi:spore germination cell wall hydrolase CwlJ-like protein